MASRAALLTALVLASACGGGGAGDNVGIGVVVYGDSTMRAECSPGALDGHCPPAIAQGLLESRAVLRQEAVGGSAAWHLQQGRNTMNAVPFAELVQGLGSAEVVVFGYGINDAQLYSPENFSAIMADLVKVSKAAGKRVVLKTPTPVWDHEELKNVGANAEVLRAIAASDPKIVLCDANALAFENGDDREVFDGVHRTARGVQLDGERLAACIQRAI